MKIEEAVETLRKYYIEYAVGCDSDGRNWAEKVKEAMEITVNYVEATIRENTYIEEIIKKENRQ